MAEENKSPAEEPVESADAGSAEAAPAPEKEAPAAEAPAEAAPEGLDALDEGIDHILIDEAQDTSPEQWRVLEALADEFLSGQGAKKTVRTVFAVGDIKQSIYSFQGADPRTFQAMRSLFSSKVPAAGHRWREVNLTVSFRSTPAILRVVDAVSPDAASPYPPTDNPT